MIVPIRCTSPVLTAHMSPPPLQRGGLKQQLAVLEGSLGSLQRQRGPAQAELEGARGEERQWEKEWQGRKVRGAGAVGGGVTGQGGSSA